MTPIPRIPAKKYPQADRPAKMVFRVKGSGTEGALYEGQTLIVPCATCGKHLAKPS